jgi:hypothetical protein
MTHPRALTVAALLALAIASSAALAQQPRPASGLDALDESRLQAELASRGLSTLLDHSFEQNKTPENQRQGVRTLAALRQLSDPNAKLSPKQRDEVIAQVVKGIEGALPTLKDPKLLMQQAGTLITEGINPDLNTLEYWGENPRLQASLRPLAETIQKIYDKAAAEAEAEANKLADQMTASSAALEKRWEEAYNLANFAKYSKAMSAYSLARAIDKADPKRKTVADGAIEALAPFDAPDSQVQPVARLRIAKLNAAKGDYPAAKKLFDSIETEAATLEPKPGLAERYEAKYFGAQAMLLAGDVAGARKGLADLQAWQKANLPKEQIGGADAAARMLEYRIISLEAEKAAGPAKEKANDAAIAVLVGLVKEYPGYRSIIFNQLLDRIPANADVTKLDPLLLSALMQKGQAELAKGTGEAIDKPAIEGAASAAAELVKRKGNEGVDAAMVEDAAIRHGSLLMKLDRKADAAAAFLAYVEAYPQGQFARNAIDNAGAMVFDLQKTEQTNPALAGLMDKFLPLAIEKFGHKELAYMYAMRLRETDRFAPAIAYFRQVPDTDANAAKARYFEMLSLKQQLDAGEPKLAEADRKAIVAQIQTLADTVTAASSAAEKTATRDADKAFYRSAPTRTALLAADLAKRELKDPNRTLSLLGTFEQQVKGMPGEDNLLSEALFLRVGSYMDLGQTDKATQNLVALLNTKGGEQGLKIVFDLLQRLDADYNAALANNDLEAQRNIAKNRADLSGYLVTWAAGNKDPKIKQYTYKYRVFDAASKQQAANLTVDPAARKKGLQDAQKLYEGLQSSENLALFTATGGDAKYGDPQVMLGLALTQYDLQNYAATIPLLSRLLNDGKLGAPRITVTQNGEQKRVDNDQFWEATYKQIDSYARLGTAKDADDKAKAGLESARGLLKRLYIQYGKGVGGKKWSANFEDVRQRIIPDYKVQELDPATQPAPAPVVQR